MIKLSDFARVQGVTPRAVQRLFKKYKSEIEGHYEERGHNGTWLDLEAQSFIRERMKQQPIMVYDERALPFYDELQSIKEENVRLREKLTEAFEELAKSKEYQLRLQGKIMDQKLLAAKAAEAEMALTDTREQLRTAEEIAEMSTQEAEEAKKRAVEAEAEIDRLKKRNLWQRIFNK